MSRNLGKQAQVERVEARVVEAGGMALACSACKVTLMFRAPARFVSHPCAGYGGRMVVVNTETGAVEVQP